MVSRRSLPPIGLLLGLAILAGCEPVVTNRSPTPDRDPERYARALEDERRAVLASREAEARFWRGKAPDLPDGDDSLAASGTGPDGPAD